MPERTECLLIVEDDADVQQAARIALASHMATIEFTASVEDMMLKVSSKSFDAVLLDMNFALGAYSGREGMDGLRAIQAADPTLSVVLMTAYGAVSLAVDALKQGAFDFVLKPWKNDKLIATVLAAAERTRCLRASNNLDLNVIERTTIERALKRYEGNIAQAANALGLSRPALYRRMAKHGL
jgi:DNA-binding NtrC family response regulator